MANKDNKFDDNVEGQYYVDEECIDCNLCREIAPDNFKANSDAGYSYVYKQPENKEEKTSCDQAIDDCPVEAIGSDGE